MTDQPQHTEQPQPTAKSHTFTEAPASWNIRYRVNGFDEQITLRGDTYAEIKPSIDKAREYVRGIVKADPLPKAAADAINTDREQAAPVATTAPQAPAAPQNGNGVMSLRIVKMQVENRADGKVNLKFFEADHKYPDLTAVKTAAEAVNMLKATGKWELFHFSQSAEFNVNFVIDYKNSTKLNSKGNPYKDIVSVSTAA